MGMFKGIVAAGHEVTAEVAATILRNGGNAFDAAIAALLVSFNAEPCMSSPGGGGFANIFTAQGNSEILDFFCQTPYQKLSPENCNFFPFTIDFGGTKEDFYIGHGSHAVPGMISGIFKLYKHYASMPFDVLAQPAIEKAKEGIPLDEFQKLDIHLLENMIAQNQRALDVFVPNGKTLEVGDPLVMPDLASFLEMLTREGEREFYEGEIAQKIARDSQSNQGHIQLLDFENYKTIRRKPIQIQYKGKKVYTTNFPSLGGAVIALGLGELNKSTLNVPHHLSKKHLERLLPVLKTMEYTTRKPENLMKEMEMYENILFSKKWGSTTHFGIYDAQGNAISITISNGEGSGYMIPGVDCFMNNMLGEAALLPEGFFSWKENTRLYSLMSPTIVVNPKDEAEIIIGTGGAGRIPGAILQVLHYLLDYQLDVEDAVHAPRMHLVESILNIEPEGETDIDFGNITPSVWEKKSMYFGGVHTITNINDEIKASGDKRRYGVVQKVE